MKYVKQVEGEDGWTKWIKPHMKGYRLACCDCGLVHTIDFRVARLPKEGADGHELRVIFRAQRNVRATAAKRRARKVRVKS